ncbi:MAG TPA: 3-carboxy-cis,cis-muconate cycloisomerase [Terriglobales bacterium]|nr:3-carboxy-cis,cis-muconate cycloisomerase [Terriglobales bacterium]
MPVRLIESLATTTELAEVFSDESVLRAMLDFEVALARAEAHADVIPHQAAETIATAAKTEAFDIAALAHDALRAGTLAIPLVKALTEKVCVNDSLTAGFVHWGATSQDVADTALVLLLKRAQTIFDTDLARLEAGLRRLSEQHKNTVMLGRTLMQPAPPITFGLKAAGWLGAVRRNRKRLGSSFKETLVVQFGGASGTLASLGDNGISIGQGIAKELGLAFSEAPWHTHRDRLAALVCSCGVLTGSLGKMARDISLLMQAEVAEASEPGGEGRGGSSTMPHKRNPTGCSIALASAQRVPGLVATFLYTMVQEHERAVGGWQAEWPTVAAVIQATGLAISSMVEVAEGLKVDKTRMRANIDATRGAIFAERAMMLLAEKIGRDGAHKLMEEATQKSIAQGRQLAEVLRGMPQVVQHIDNEILGELELPEKYLGAAEQFRLNLLATK